MMDDPLLMQEEDTAPAADNQPSLPEAPAAQPLPEEAEVPAEELEQPEAPTLPPAEEPAAPEPPDAAPDMPQEAAEPAGEDALPPAQTEAPIAPTSIRKKRYWRSLLTGNPATVPAEVRRQSGADEWELSDEQREYRMLHVINKSWAADHLPRTQEQIHAEWPKERAALARRFGVRNNEREVFMALSQDAADEPRRTAAVSICEKSFLAGLDGEIAPDIIDITETLSEEDAEKAGTLADESFARGQEKRKQLIGTAEQLVRGLKFYSSIEDEVMGLPRMIMSMPDLVRAADKLTFLTEEDQNTVLYLAAGMVKAEQGEEPPGLATRAARAMRRGVLHMGTGAIQAAGNMNVAFLHRISKMFKSAELNRLADEADGFLQMLEKLRRFSQEDLRPLVLEEEKNKAASYFITAAEAVPSAILSCCGGAGLAVLTMGSVGDSVASARARSPQSQQELQFYAGALAGALQAGLYMNLNRLGGNLLSQSIGRLSQASGMPAYTMGTLGALGGVMGEGGKLMAAGKISQGLDMGLQEAASELSDAESNIDWKLFGDNMMDIEANMHEAAALLPVLLLSSGHVGLQHFRSPRAILGDGGILRECGLSEEQVESIKAEPSIERQSDMIRDAFRDSVLWSTPFFLGKVNRAMQLLNGANSKPFEDADVVADFLKLPPKQRKQLQESQLVNDLIEPQKKPRFTEALRLWGRWWNAARMNKGPNGLKNMPDVVEKDARLQMSNNIKADPGSTMFDDLNALTYKFLLNYYTVDTLMKDSKSMAEWEKSGEIRRGDLLKHAALAVLRRGPGEQTWEGYDENAILTPEEQQHHPGLKAIGRNSKAGAMLNRLMRATGEKQSRNIYPDGDAFAKEFRESVDKIATAIPDMEDFQTALSRGLAPDEAYAHVLAHELNLPADELLSTYRQAENIEVSRPNQKSYQETCKNLFKVYSNITGVQVESETGSDGQTYYRVRRPDGRYTRWHEKEEYAIYDVAGLAFMKSMKRNKWGSLSERLDMSAKSRAFDFTRADERNTMTEYDHLCVKAMEDLDKMWKSVDTTCQPGARSMYYRKYLRGFADQAKDDGVTPLLRVEDTTGGEYTMDDMSVNTPVAMIQARFYVYWRRMVDSRLVQLVDIAGYLDEHQYSSWRTYQNPFGGKKTDSKEMLPSSIVKHNVEIKDARRHFFNTRSNADDMCGMMAEYCTERFLATLQERDVPESMKVWLATLPFTITKRPENRGKGSRSKIVRRDNQDIDERELTVWANHKVAYKLKSMSTRLKQARENRVDTEYDELMDPLIEDLFGENDYLKSERAWLFKLGGEEAVQNISPACWNLLHSPYYAWYSLDTPEGELVRAELDKTLRNIPNLVHMADVAEADLVEYSLKYLHRVLGNNPELHHFSRITGWDNSLKRITTEKNVAGIIPEEEALSMRSTAKVETEHENGKISQMLNNNTETMLSLQILDTLRNMAVSMPHASSAGVMWKNKIYGYNGIAPAGLEADFEVKPPLLPLYDMMRSLNDRKLMGENPVMVGGEELLDLQFDDDMTPLMLGNTVYQNRNIPAERCRLMLGNMDSVDEMLRLPYLVCNRHGVYLNESQAVNKMADPMRDVVVPLQSFGLPLERVYPSNGANWAVNVLRKNIQNTLNLAADAYKRGGLHENERARMMEYIMRLGEDSGFSDKVGTMKPEEMSLGDVRLFNMLRDMMRAACLPEAHDSLERLKNMAVSAKADAEYMSPIMKSLLHANGTLPNKWKFTPDHYLLRKRKKERKKPVKQEGLTVKRDVDSEKMPVRMGWKARWYPEDYKKQFEKHDKPNEQPEAETPGPGESPQ